MVISVRYKNHRGETSERKIIPLEISLGNNEYHKETQWLLQVWDLDKEDYRTYALKDIKEWLDFPNTIPEQR
ncbi:MAG: WYL domain-containing protein [Nanoarchaeota archaeon]|nr:WYL domain-containing protein [Nanoarchaeota archaeon]MBU1103241.1 WYL domain-containing protein [Nanoarchaeota archaeon]